MKRFLGHALILKLGKLIEANTKYNKCEITDEEIRAAFERENGRDVALTTVAKVRKGLGISPKREKASGNGHRTTAYFKALDAKLDAVLMALAEIREKLPVEHSQAV